MRAIVLGLLLVSASAAADGLVVSKKVTKLETKDPAVTKITVLLAVPDVLACAKKVGSRDVDIKVKKGKVVSVATDRHDRKFADCIGHAFKKMKVGGSFTATVHLEIKPDPRAAHHAETTDGVRVDDPK